jgi:hypothetical protein
MSQSKEKDVYLSALILANEVTITPPPEVQPVNALGLSPLILAARVPATVSKMLYFAITSDVRRGQIPYELRLRAPGEPLTTRVFGSGMITIMPIGYGGQILPLKFTTDNYGAFEIALYLDGDFAGAVRVVVAPADMANPPAPSSGPIWS